MFLRIAWSLDYGTNNLQREPACCQEEGLEDQRPGRQSWPCHGRTQNPFFKKVLDVTDERILKTRYRGELDRNLLALERENNGSCSCWGRKRRNGEGKVSPSHKPEFAHLHQ